MDDPGALDPRVAEWFDANPMMGQPFDDFSSEVLAMARGPVGAPPTHPIARVTDDVPLQREGSAEEVAAVVSFLLSDEASFVTGTDLLVDGGVCAAAEQ